MSALPYSVRRSDAALEIELPSGRTIIVCGLGDAQQWFRVTADSSGTTIIDLNPDDAIGRMRESNAFAHRVADAMEARAEEKARAARAAKVGKK